MALVLNDRVKETTATNGTGTIDLAGAETGFETFVAGVGNTNTTYYAIVHQAADEFEVGLGTVSDSTPDTLSRTTIISSSNSDSAVNFSAGTKDVFCTLPASKAVFADASGNVGIGLTSPASKLHVRAGTDNNFEVQETGGDLRLLAINDARAANVAMEFAASQFDFLTGAVTVGDTAVANLKIGNSGDVIQATAKKDGTDDVDLAFLTQASGGTTGERMRILGGGGLQLAAGNNISNASGDMTIDVAGTIILDSSQNVNLYANGTHFAYLQNENSDFRIGPIIQDKDFIVRGNDGGTYIDGLKIDFSEGARVGIGDSSPDAQLHVNSGSANVVAKFESSDSIAAIQFTDSGGSAEIGCSGTSNTFYPNGVLKMSLDSSGNLVASGNITAYGSPSDLKLKENIEVIDNALDKVKQLKGITYDLKSDGNRLTGLIAQDLEKVLPEAVYTAKDLEDEEHLAIRYGNTVGLLVEAIKEQQEQIEALTAKVKELEDK